MSSGLDSYETRGVWGRLDEVRLGYNNFLPRFVAVPRAGCAASTQKITFVIKMFTQP